ncbi:8-amino-7-oxononanoate synthase 2 [Pedobacter sp. Bi27]|uniref:aminotransferase class I/II-fold pyridoxal phosphate-dependent enzyme n=1 Tax=unclassified Pedobacter TaxID=2628915 RepID=UPI001D1F9D1E|nr:MULTISPECIES: pyridoxal phosphate-dependent aminotransferase family protein [unclassified Pedobacter]CAH0150464.1 8-amino-7-oxononanoate synthase 2 [Pedobacter sp. Bi36]CAH0206553.1 8-amino-7-oxononanoate synthase 2 [Pedobacter sp. Bi126]CAH0264723.1 8-amino-7-oxononanoate synthase 2 [Pedobacter sp. Bi27]
MSKIEQFLNGKLQERKDNLSIRNLSTNTPPFDFCSNDYLGFARSSELKKLIDDTIATLPNYLNGAGGSRLLSGNTALTEETEQFIADFHLAESGLIFNSGYDANVGLLSSIPQRGDTIITDELIHASIIDGCRLSHATRYKFLHNDINDLETKLKLAKGNVFVVVESVYSMDGDIAPLIEVSNLCERYQANLIVDEAHATGVFGASGSGLINQLNLTSKVFARIVTFGKALGVHGAIILASKNLRHYLINFARSFIYTTAAPIHNIVAVRSAYQHLNKINHQLIHQKIALFRKMLKEQNINALDSESAIQGILFSSNEATKLAATALQSKGFDVRAILSPTVALGKERLRICLHNFNTDEEIISLVNNLKELN